MNEMNERNQLPASRNLSGKTVAIVFGVVTLVLMVIWGVVGGWWMALAVPAGFAGALLVLCLFQSVFWPMVLGALFLLSRLIPRPIRTWLAGKTDRRLTPLASTLAFAAVIAILIGIFCLTTGDPKGVLIFTFMISLVVGFFALIHRIDVRWRAYRNQKEAANQASDATSKPAPGAGSSAHQG
jgi:hypothetical protein